MLNCWIGTTGFTNKEWRGTFYPPELPEPDFLRFYSQQFSSVEINGSFHRLPTVRTLQGWGKETPDRFAFALKAPRRITHDLRLRDVGDLVTAFCDTAKVLREKLGVLLFQLPSFLKKDLPRLEDFLHQLPPELRLAFEFRNPSWLADDVLECLRRFDAALCISEHDNYSTPLEQTAHFGYLRLRRQAYGDADLAGWMRRLSETQWTDAYVYFKHDVPGRSACVAAAFSRLFRPHVLSGVAESA